MIATKNGCRISVNVQYSFGDRVVGRFHRDEVAGLPARRLVERVIELAQDRGPATRTAIVLGEVMKSARQLDAEVIVGPPDDTCIGDPIDLGDVVIPADGRKADRGPEPDEVTILLSEPYRAGARTWRGNPHE